MNFRYLQGIYIPQAYYHKRPQDRPHKKEIGLFSNKISITKVGTLKEGEKMASGFHTSLDFFLTSFENSFR